MNVSRIIKVELRIESNCDILDVPGNLEIYLPSSNCLPAKINLCWSGGMPSLSCKYKVLSKRVKHKSTTNLHLNLGLHIFDGIAGLHLQCDGLPSQSFHKNLHFDSCLELWKP